MEECNNDGAAGRLVLHCASCRAQSGRETLRVFTAASPMWEGGREGGRGTATCSLWWELRVSFAVLFVVCDEICATLSMFSSSGTSLAKSEVTRIPCMMAVQKCFRLVLKRQEGLNYLSGQYLGT